ncbi:MAG: glycosyltransferase family 9 protein [Candidatus Krumholzibacteria bacterium]|nr:glycosyltransferase family 9 protein [Candidatus Krumholzibacteria bacterium]
MDLSDEARRRGTRLRILVTRLRYLGDVILTTPAVAALKERYPEAEIHYATERPYAEILERNPDLAGILRLSRNAWMAFGEIARIRSLRFTACIDLFYNPRSAILLYLSGIPIRAGGSRKLRGRLYTHRFEVPAETRSAMEHHVAAMGVFDVGRYDSLPRVYLAREEADAGRELLAQSVGRREAGRRIIAMHPGGTWQAKRWPPGSFARLALLARERIGAHVVVVTGPGEEGIAERVRAEAGSAVRVLPLKPLRTIAAILASCDAVVANDGGIMHLAVAIGRPTVAVFGPTEPDIWFPYEGKGPFALVSRRMDCAPCHKHRCESPECLESIAPEQALGRIEEVLAWKGPVRPRGGSDA